MSVLKIENVSKSFGGVKAINETDFAIERQEIFGLIGPNGAGKTTMFNIITGNYKPTTGDIYFGEEKITGKKNYEIVRKGIARTFQNIRLFGTMSVLDNVLIGFDHQTKYTYLETMLRFPRFFSQEKKYKAKAMEILEFLNIDEYADNLATDLSYGIQRKVEIARAIATNPKLLLLDEPAAGMNPNETKELGELLLSIREHYNLTILLIEHDMKFVNHICERVLVLDYGKVIFEGKIEDAVKDTEVIKAYLGDFQDA